MTEDQSSFMICHFLTGLSHAMPAEEQTNLSPYQSAAGEAGSDPTAEWHRAYKCAKWAQQIVSLPVHHHLMAQVEKAIEVVKEVEGTIGGELTDLLEVPLRGSVSPRFEVEITWVYEAVHVAEAVASKVGWAAVPWEQLVREMLNVPVS